VGPSRARIAWLFALLAAPSAGCFSSYNPGYFPYLLPPGPIVQEHAKPRGPGYFRDFDPKACNLEVTPANATAPPGAQIVLVATVYDKDGQARRDRRVEWMLEGPGNIIEVDESGLYAGRGYKVDNKYAVSYTNYTSHTITRGNNDPADDVSICPGQTFCVISSAVPGETVVTAYAPGVFNWERGRVVTRVIWGEGRFKFPDPGVARSGGEYVLTTTINKLEQDGPGPLPNYRVRYRIIDASDAPTAVLVSRAGEGTTGTQSGVNAKEVEAAVGTDGTAAVRLMQRDARPGHTRVAVEVVKSPENGVGPGAVVGRRETTIEWAAPQVQLNVVAPPTAAANGNFTATVSLANVGPIDSRDAVVRVSLSDGATLARSEPPPVKVDAGALVFDLAPVAVSKKQQITLEVKPAKVGSVTVTAEASTSDGLKAENRATTRVEQGRLAVHLEAPPSGLSGQQVPVRVAVTNAGAVPAGNVVVWAQFDDALTHGSGKNPVELTAGTLAPGETKTLELPLSAKAAGRFAVRASATADGNLSAASAPVAVDLRRAELQLAVTGPRLAYVNQEFAWTVTVGNPAETSVSNVVVRATLPTEVRLTDAADGKPGPGSVEWKIAELKPGESKTLKLTATAAKLTDRASVSAVAQGDVPGSSGEPLQAKADAAVAVVGVPAVSLELATPPGLVEVGKRATFQVRVKNRGTVSARNLEVTAFATAELKPARGSGATDGRIDPDGKVVFRTLEELRPGETATFTVEVEAVKPGDARFRAEVRAAHLTSPLKEEQATRVVGGR
jgi:hypothetical protein